MAYRRTTMPFMKNVITYALLLLALSAPAGVHGQALTLTLEQAIAQAREMSPDAQSARHTFRSAYWNYRYYRANYLPALTLTSAPYMDRAINRITMGDGSVQFVEQNLLSTDLSLSVTQNIALTGGTLSLTTSAQRLDLLSEHTSSWQTSPVILGYSQSLFGYNSLKWDRRIEPVRYEEARKSYVETLELVAATATQKFFDLATAQSNLEIATTNYANADTLYALNEEANCMSARIEVENAMQELRSYLGIREDTDLQVRLNDSIPDFVVNLNEALLLANANSPDIQNMRRRELESESNVAQARANAGLKADIYLRFGLTQTGDKLRDAYRDPLNQQYVSLTLSLPILDWGRGKGQVRVARSNRDLVYTQVEQDKTDFQLNVRKLVKQFNLQAQRVRIAARTDRTAQRRAEVARRLYLLGKSSVLDLNASISEKDSARRNYIAALNEYWSLFYTLRSLTLHDFEHDRPLEEDLERLLE